MRRDGLGSMKRIVEFLCVVHGVTRQITWEAREALEAPGRCPECGEPLRIRFKHTSEPAA